MSDASVDAEAFRAFEAAGWHRRAAGYDAFFAPITGRVAGDLLDAAGVGAGTRLLDVATGPGEVAALAARRGAFVVGVDLAPAMVELARARHPGLDVREGDVEALPFAAGAFQAVVSNFGLGHFPRPERAVGECRRVVAPGGVVALSWWDQPERTRLLGVFVEAVGAVGAESPPHVPLGPPVFRFSDRDALTRLMTGAGLEAVAVRTVTFTHRFSGPDALWAGMLAGSLRLATTILAQPVETQERIRSAFVGLLRPYGGDDALEIPVAVHVAAGRTAIR
jgi:SAM-dependent methyltransferase